MTFGYRLYLLGDTTLFNGPVEEALSNQLSEFNLEIGTDVQIATAQEHVNPAPILASVGLFFGTSPPQRYHQPPTWRPSHTMIPIVSKLCACEAELPKELSVFNAMPLDTPGAPIALAAAILECLGIIPARRKVFLSYRRTESRGAALGLFDELSARQFDVFLDTHEIRPGAVFQDALWHHLCESDVLLMLDTPGYFSSRWTREEFGRANLKKAAILRIGWPDVAMADTQSVSTSIQLTESDLTSNRQLRRRVIDRIADNLEMLRSKSVAVREANLIGSYRAAVESLNGSIEHPGPLRKLVTHWPDGKMLSVYPAVGVPDAILVNRIADDVGSGEFGLLYDHVGVLDSWIVHLDWFGEKIERFRWIRADDAASALERFVES